MEIRFRPLSDNLKESLLSMRKFNSINSFMLFLERIYEDSFISFSCSFDTRNVSFYYQCRYDDKVGWNNVFVVSINGDVYGYLTFDNINMEKFIDICKIV